MSRKRKIRIPREARFFDYSLFFVIIFIACFGVVMIHSASYYSAQMKDGLSGNYYALRQAIFLLIGTVVMLFVSVVPYEWYTKLYGIGWVLAVALMAITDKWGVEINYSRRWLKIGPVQFQPAEFVKLEIIVLMAVMITSLYTIMDQKKMILIIAVLVLPPAILIAVENLSSAIIVMGIAAAMYFVACRHNKKFLVMLLILIAVVTFLVMSVTIPSLGELIKQVPLLNKAYRLNRILVWLDPEAYPEEGGYQVLQGLYAVGSGGFFGKGLGNGIQKLTYLPESQNDMIFAVICEELGVFGAICLLLLFAFMIYRLMVIASNAPDMLGSMLVIGVMAHISLQVVLNVMVVINLIPNTGISLPLVSYGGTSVVFLMAEFGMALGVSRRIRLN